MRKTPKRTDGCVGAGARGTTHVRGYRERALGNSGVNYCARGFVTQMRSFVVELLGAMENRRGFFAESGGINGVDVATSV